MAMQIPAEITIRVTPKSDAIESQIRAKLDKLNTFYDHIMTCRVVVEQSQNKQHKGKIYNVRLDLTVPGEELVVNKVHNEDVYVAIRDAFNAMTRQLQDFVQKQRGELNPMTR